MEELLEQLLDKCRPYTKKGRVATYIPELAKGNLDDLGIAILDGSGRLYCAGDYKKNFTIQSVIKPILLLQALMDNGEEYVRSRIGVESTGKPFDAINISDQTIHSEHLNPMVVAFVAYLILNACFKSNPDKKYPGGFCVEDDYGLTTKELKSPFVLLKTTTDSSDHGIGAACYY